MSNRIPLDYHWQHPLPNDFWPERYGGFQTPEDFAVALAVTECADAWRRNDPVTVANILRTSDTLRIAAQAAYFVSQPVRHDPNPPSIANWLREQARQDYLVRSKMPMLMGSDWDNGGTAEQRMLAELDMITFAELVAADDEPGVIKLVSSGGIDQTPVFGSASAATRMLARLWTPEIYQQMRETFGGMR